MLDRPRWWVQRRQSASDPGRSEFDVQFADGIGDLRTGVLVARGVAFGVGREEISPGGHEAQTLNLPSGVPILEVLHTSLDQDDQPFEVSRFVHRADRAGLVYRFPVED